MCVLTKFYKSCNLWLRTKSAKDTELIKGIKKSTASTSYNPGLSFKGIITQDKSKTQPHRNEIFNWSED